MVSIKKSWFRRPLAGVATGLLMTQGLVAASLATPHWIQQSPPTSVTAVGGWLCKLHPTLPLCRSK